MRLPSTSTAFLPDEFQCQKVGIDHHGETDLSGIGLTRRDSEENNKAFL